MTNAETPVEIIAAMVGNQLWAQREGVIETILIPEQCFLVYLRGKAYHITVEEVES